MTTECSAGANGDRHGERLAVLETEMADIRPKIDAMYDIMMQQKGVGRLGKALFYLFGGGTFGALVVTKWAALLAWIGKVN